jgi:hypothetical protein
MKTCQPNSDAQFAELLARFPPAIVTLAKRSLPKLCRSFPGTNQLVYNYRSSLLVAFSPSERGYEAIVSIAISQDAVRLYFSKELPDPRGLLEGSGTKVRSVALRAVSDLDHGDVHELIMAAVRRASKMLSHTRLSRPVIKSVSKRVAKHARPAAGTDASCHESCGTSLAPFGRAARPCSLAHPV